MKIILLGPPGAGKGTQAKVLSQRLNLVHISTGDLLRQNVSKATQLGLEAKDYMNKGALVPDTLVTSMLSERFNQEDVKKGFILDGYPRTLKQAESLDVLLKEKQYKIDKVFYLDTSEKIVVQRLSGRLVCSKCSANFHKTNMPPKKDMVCDACGASLYQRQDDKEETIKKRLQVYQQESAPLIEYYKSKGKLVRVDSDQDANVVLEEIIRRSKENDTPKV
ncbi:MAG: adenylate kinase [Candidatus Omnitrophica bacterium]|nr:adenylate kinase [Candidatus Omnitrophota bacterium]MDD5653007.1 adenylate kinase [Candidatus Omnitrophota bacterium]